MNVVQFQEFRYVNQFQCIADKCEDSCCGTYQINLEDEAVEMYRDKAPELLDYILLDDEFGNIFKSKDNTCALMDCSGLCSIHRDRGTSFLSDTCHFFPRVHSRVGKSHFITGSASCPEVSRILLADEDPFALVDVDVDRVPHSIMGADVDEEKEKRTLHTHRVFMRECQDSSQSFTDSALKILHVAQQLDAIDKPLWCEHVDDLFAQVNVEEIKSTLTATEKYTSYEVFQVFCEFYTQGFLKPVWRELLADVDKAFSPKGNAEHEQLGLNPQKIHLYQSNKDIQLAVDDALKRYFGYEISRRVYPYAKESGSDAGVFASTFPIIIYLCTLRTAILARLDEAGQVPSTQDIASSLYLIIQRTEHITRNFGPLLEQKQLVNMDFALRAIMDVEPR